MYYFAFDEKKVQLLNIKHIARNTGKFSEHENLNQYDTINKIIAVSSAEANRNYYEVISVSYFDPLNMKVIKNLFYIKRYKLFIRIVAVLKNGKRISSEPIFTWIDPLPREKILLEKAYRKFLENE